MSDNIQVLSRDASANVAQNRVLRNTYALLGLSLIPTAIGAMLGMQMNFSFMAQHPIIFTLGFFAVMFVLTRLRKRPALAGDGAAEEVESTVEATPELVEKYREQIERELRKP